MESDRLMEIEELKEECAKLYKRMKDEFKLRERRIKAVYSHRKPDRIPVRIDTGAMWYLTQVGIKFQKITKEFNKTPDAPTSLAENYASYISPSSYREFCLPYTKRVFEECNGERLSLDGNYTDFLTDIARELPHLKYMGVSQEVDMAKVRELLGDEIILGGNVNPVKVLLQGNRSDIFEKVKESIEKGTKKGTCFTFIIGVDDTEALRGTSIENIKAFIEAGREYRRL